MTASLPGECRVCGYGTGWRLDAHASWCEATDRLLNEIDAALPGRNRGVGRLYPPEPKDPTMTRTRTLLLAASLTVATVVGVAAPAASQSFDNPSSCRRCPPAARPAPGASSGIGWVTAEVQRFLDHLALSRFLAALNAR